MQTTPYSRTTYQEKKPHWLKRKTKIFGRSVSVVLVALAALAIAATAAYAAFLAITFVNADVTAAPPPAYAWSGKSCGIVSGPGDLLENHVGNDLGFTATGVMPDTVVQCSGRIENTSDYSIELNDPGQTLTPGVSFAAWSGSALGSEITPGAVSDNGALTFEVRFEDIDADQALPGLSFPLEVSPYSP